MAHSHASRFQNRRESPAHVASVRVPPTRAIPTCSRGARCVILDSMGGGEGGEGDGSCGLVLRCCSSKVGSVGIWIFGWVRFDGVMIGNGFGVCFMGVIFFFDSFQIFL